MKRRQREKKVIEICMACLKEESSREQATGNNPWCERKLHTYRTVDDPPLHQQQQQHSFT
jgi:hypothetical protein